MSNSGVGPVDIAPKLWKKVPARRLRFEDTSPFKNVANYGFVRATVQVLVGSDQRIGCVGEGVSSRSARIGR